MTPNKFTVTLPALRKAGACVYGYNRVVRAIQGREFTDEDAKLNTYIRFAHADPISIRLIVASNGMDDALWALRCIDNAANDKDLRLFSVCCARQVEHLMRDPRSTNALDVAERHANGKATDRELSVFPADAFLDDLAKAAAERGMHLIGNGKRIVVSPIVPPGWWKIAVKIKPVAAA